MHHLKPARCTDLQIVAALAGAVVIVVRAGVNASLLEPGRGWTGSCLQLDLAAADGKIAAVSAVECIHTRARVQVCRQ